MERRQAKRVESTNLVTVDFLDHDAQSSPGRVARTLNISIAGAAIEISSLSPLSIPVGRELLLAIDLGARSVSARGRVVYSKQKDERETVVGIMFTELSPDDRRAISGFIGD